MGVEMKQFELQMIEDLKQAIILIKINSFAIKHVESKYLQSSSLVSKETFDVFSKITTHSNNQLCEKEVKELISILNTRKQILLGGE